MDDIKNDLILITTKFIRNVKVAYISELSSNIDSKRNELDAISKAKSDAIFINDIIDKLENIVELLKTDSTKAESLKGGIQKCIIK